MAYLNMKKPLFDTINCGGGNGVHPASKVGEHSHPQTAQDVPQGQLTKNSISNGPLPL
jgi:hypothetical protein